MDMCICVSEEKKKKKDIRTPFKRGLAAVMKREHVDALCLCVRQEVIQNGYYKGPWVVKRIMYGTMCICSMLVEI